jgi:hypothetical protein
MFLLEQARANSGRKPTDPALSFFSGDFRSASGESKGLKPSSE